MGLALSSFGLGLGLIIEAQKWRPFAFLIHLNGGENPNLKTTIRRLADCVFRDEASFDDWLS